jgi:hypothetical protein
LIAVNRGKDEMIVMIEIAVNHGKDEMIVIAVNRGKDEMIVMIEIAVNHGKDGMIVMIEIVVNRGKDGMIKIGDRDRGEPWKRREVVIPGEDEMKGEITVIAHQEMILTLLLNDQEMTGKKKVRGDVLRNHMVPQERTTTEITLRETVKEIVHREDRVRSRLDETSHQSEEQRSRSTRKDLKSFVDAKRCGD